MKYYLAVDIGASSGRLILGHREEGKMILEEVHRFGNGMEMQNGHLTWDVDQLFAEIITGMKKCAELGKFPESIGVDTWAVDFVLLDAQDQRIGDAVGYRDHRTQGLDQKVYEVIGEEELYLRTGHSEAAIQYDLSADGCKRADTGTDGAGRNASDDTGLSAFPAEWAESDGIYQRFHHTAFESADKGLGLGSH